MSLCRTILARGALRTSARGAARVASVLPASFSRSLHTAVRRSPSLSLNKPVVSSFTKSFLPSSIRSFASSSDPGGNPTPGSKPFDKILIANRGEIACRIIRSAKLLGIKTVAIYSEPDARSKHVKLADEAVCVGPAASSESYLRADKILEACKATGAQAVHPGYGFLSENTDFCDMLEKHGIVFIGPKPEAIENMGLKIESKKIALAAGVSTVPGFVGGVAGPEEAIEKAKEIGYPVMIKASAGGGGKGMRIAWNDAEVTDGFRYSRDEAKKSFSNDTIFIEKYIEDPRHIEIQVLLDRHGNAVYLNERECSIQRRNQKVIEEAPSTFLDEKTRKEMGEQAIALARAVNYESAGTVEMLVDKNRNFYFLEMNTRLQVEHPITEYITGVDIVEQMLRVAAGQPLTVKQNEIGIHGWAIESRVYAEDPLKDFLPSIGRLVKYEEPPKLGFDAMDIRKDEQSDIRCDTGILEGSEISIYYDPLICKLITHADTREEAIEKMRKSLDSYVIRGVTHNINFLRAVMDHPRFLDGRTTTGFIEEEYGNGFEGTVLNKTQKHALYASSVLINLAKLVTEGTISGQNAHYDGEDAAVEGVEQLVLDVLDHEEIPQASSRLLSFSHDGSVFSLDLELSTHEGVIENITVSSDYKYGQMLIHLDVNGTEHTLQMVDSSVPNRFTVQHCGSNFTVSVMSPRVHELSSLMPAEVVVDTSKMLLSPMPGAVVSIAVSVGDRVLPGQEVCVVEAMKMQNALRVEKEAVVKSININVGDTVAADEVLIEFE